MNDRHSEILELAVHLAQLEAAGHRLSGPQRVISDIAWIGTQFSPNGFDGWLAYTSCERMRGTLSALQEVGCTEVAQIVRSALEIAGVDPAGMADDEREEAIEALTEEARGELEKVDWRFHDVYEPSMELCRHYAREHTLL